METGERVAPSKGCRASAVVVILVLVQLYLLLLPVSEAQTVTQKVYCVAGGMCYNGSTMGYIMSYGNTSGLGAQGRQYLRVAFSVNRPTINVGDGMGVMIRTDGYFTRDSGWWYIVKGASINSINLYYPNGSLAKSVTGKTTDNTGVYRDDVFLLSDSSYPMGRYKVNASVTGPATGAPGKAVSLNMITINNTAATIFFDMGGELSISMPDIPNGNRGTQVRINGTVNQPNGKVFNSTFVIGVPGFSGYAVNVSVVRPDGIIDRTGIITSNGSYGLSYNTTGKPVGKYYAISFVEYDLGNQVERGKHTFGRAFQEFMVYGPWPEVGLAIAPSTFGVVLLILIQFILLQGVKRVE